MRRKEEELRIKHFVTGIILIPMFAWFIISTIQILKNKDEYLSVFFYYPMNAILSIFFIIIALYHGTYEIKFMLREFLKSEKKVYVLETIFNNIAILCGISAVLAIVNLHLSGIVKI